MEHRRNEYKLDVCVDSHLVNNQIYNWYKQLPPLPCQDPSTLHSTMLIYPKLCKTSSLGQSYAST